MRLLPAQPTLIKSECRSSLLTGPFNATSSLVLQSDDLSLSVSLPAPTEASLEQSRVGIERSTRAFKHVKPEEDSAGSPLAKPNQTETEGVDKPSAQVVPTVELNRSDGERADKPQFSGKRNPSSSFLSVLHSICSPSFSFLSGVTVLTVILFVADMVPRVQETDKVLETMQPNLVEQVVLRVEMEQQKTEQVVQESPCIVSTSTSIPPAEVLLSPPFPSQLADAYISVMGNISHYPTATLAISSSQSLLPLTMAVLGCLSIYLLLRSVSGKATNLGSLFLRASYPHSSSVKTHRKYRIRSASPVDSLTSRPKTDLEVEKQSSLLRSPDRLTSATRTMKKTAEVNPTQTSTKTRAKSTGLKQLDRSPSLALDCTPTKQARAKSSSPALSDRVTRSMSRGVSAPPTHEETEGFVLDSQKQQPCVKMIRPLQGPSSSATGAARLFSKTPSPLRERSKSTASEGSKPPETFHFVYIHGINSALLKCSKSLIIGRRFR